MRGIIIITIYSSIISLHIKCMNHDLIKSSDKHIYSIPQHIIDFSNVLVEKQSWKKKLSITPTRPMCVSIDKKNLDLFFDACNAIYNTDDSFDSFFDSLSSENKSLLTLLTDKNKLNSPIIIIKILSYYDLTPIIKPYLEIDTITNFFYNKIVQNNIKTKIKKVPNRNRCKFNKNYSIEFNETENFTIIPNIVIKNNTYIFNGHTQQVDSFHTIKTFNAQEKIIYSTARNDDKITYYLTDNTPKKNKTQKSYLERTRCLLTCNSFEQIINTKVITHKNPLIKTSFSSNGHYLATYSKASLDYPYHTLLVTKLGTKKSDFHNILIPFFNTITEFCFNPQSSILITGTLSNNDNNNILLQTWKPSKGECLQTLDITHGKKIDIIQFNECGTRMLTTTSTKHNGTYILWNTENPFNIISIKDITLLNDTITHFPQFNNPKNILVLPTQKGCLIFINSIDGETISQSKPYNSNSDRITNIVFTPNNKFCITNTTLLHKKNQDTTSLWKLNTGSFVGYLLSNKNNTRGVGLTPNLRYIVTTFNNHTMIKTDLLDDHSIQFFIWLKKNVSLLQLYALYHAYKSYKQKQNPSPEIISLLEQLPTSSCNVKKIINFYLSQLPSFQKVKNKN